MAGIQPIEQTTPPVKTFSITTILRILWSIQIIRVTMPFVTVIALWQLSVEVIGLSEFFYPTPKTTVEQFGILIKNGVLLAYINASIFRYLLGCTIGIGIGIPLAILVSTNRFVASLLLPIIDFFQAIVEMAWIPIFVLWFGYGMVTIVITLAYVVAFPVMFNTIQGIRRIPKAYLNAVRVLGANRRQLIIEVILPGALPDIVTGIRIGAGYAFRGLIGAEMIAARAGLGFMLFEARQQGLVGRIAVGMIVLGTLWLFLDRVYLRALEQATIERWGLVTAHDKE